MNFEKKTYFTLSYSDLDEAISEEFEIDFEMVPEEELMNSIKKHFHVEPQTLNSYDKEKIKAKRYSFLTGSLLNEMCYRGKIPPGDYLVEVYW